MVVERGIDMTHQIAKLPIRTYTPIPALEYNATVEDDIKETEKFLNVDVGSLRSLSPVVAQTHEPHESLRTIPWVRTPGTTGVGPTLADVDPGIMLYRNGVWKNAIPAFDELAGTSADIDALIASIDANNVRIAALLAAMETVRDTTETSMDTAIANAASVYKNLIRTRQLAASDCVLYGQETITIPAGTGTYNPASTPHADVDFVTRDEQGYSTENPDFPWGSPVYRAYCHPHFLLGGGYDEQDWTYKSSYDPRVAALSYRSRWSKWNLLRYPWARLIAMITLAAPRPELRRWYEPLATTYPDYSSDPNSFASDFGFVSDPPPTILINITSDSLSGAESGWFPIPLADDHRPPGEEGVLCENPVLTLTPGEYSTSSVAVGATCATPGANIHYTIDHTVPTEASPVMPAIGFDLDVPGRLRVKAFDPAGILGPSYVVTGLYVPFSAESNWIRPYVWISIDPDDSATVLGFKAWFENYSYSPGGVSQRDREITFTWQAYGRRKTPPHIWTEA